MRYLNKKSFLPVLFVFGVLVASFFIFENTLIIGESNTLALVGDNLVLASSKPVFSDIPWNLSDKISEAKQLLMDSKPLGLEYARIGKTAKQELVRKQIALAILDKNTGKIFERRIWVRESDIKNYQKTRVITLMPDLYSQAGINEEQLDIQAQWWNSFNTPYQIAGHQEFIVIANKYPLLTSSVPFPKERSKNQYSEIIYVPFSDALQRPEIVQAGKDHIEKMVDAAFQSLQLRDVKSKSVPGKLVTEVVNKDFVKNIIVVEHIDPGAFAVASDGGRALTERVLAIIGSNQDKAFAYTGSPAGASGIAQFIKSTYNITRKNYPTAGLVSDFNLGMADHVNAFKSMVLFFDSHKQEIENKITRKDVLTQIGGGVNEEMLALAYNGGPGKVIRSVNNYGLAWISSQLNLTRPAIFRPETIGYFNKFEAIKNLNLF